MRLVASKAVVGELYLKGGYNFNNLNSKKLNCRLQWQTPLPAPSTVAGTVESNPHSLPSATKTFHNSVKPFVVSVKAVRISVKAGGTLVSLKRCNGCVLQGKSVA